MNILVRLILYRMKKQRNFENAEMLSHISDHNDIGMSGKNFGPLKWYIDRNFFGGGGGEVAKNKLFREKFFGRPCLSLRPPKNEGLATPLLMAKIGTMKNIRRGDDHKYRTPQGRTKDF